MNRGSKNALVHLLANKDTFILTESDTVGVQYKTGDTAYRFVLRPASSSAMNFTPYTMSNRELTEKVQDLLTRIAALES